MPPWKERARQRANDPIGLALPLTCSGPAIRKDDPAKHLDKLMAAADRRKTPGIVAPRANEGRENAAHNLIGNGNSSEGGRHAYRTTVLSVRQ